MAKVNVAALEVPLRPTDIPIVDQTGTLSDDQKQGLAQQIARERTESGNQLAVVMIPSLGGEAIEDYSLDIARAWGIGTSENNNGVLLLIVKDDKLLRIEVGSGLEGSLTDVQTGRIIRNDITPQFKQGRYYEGISAGLTSILAAIHGEYKAAPANDKGSRFPWETVLIFGLIALSWLGSILARSKSWWGGGVIGGLAGGATGFITGSVLIGSIGLVVLALVGLIFDKIVSDNYSTHTGRGHKPSWWAGGGFFGGGSGGSGGDGFGGFGGGGFNGGGSSGSW